MYVTNWRIFYFKKLYHELVYEKWKLLFFLFHLNSYFFHHAFRLFAMRNLSLKVVHERASSAFISL